jgi:hypothetical protein
MRIRQDISSKVRCVWSLLLSVLRKVLIISNIAVYFIYKLFIPDALPSKYSSGMSYA